MAELNEVLVPVIPDIPDILEKQQIFVYTPKQVGPPGGKGDKGDKGDRGTSILPGLYRLDTYAEEYEFEITSEGAMLGDILNVYIEDEDKYYFYRIVSLDGDYAWCEPLARLTGMDGKNYIGQSQIPSISSLPTPGTSYAFTYSLFSIRVPEVNEYINIIVSYNNDIYYGIAKCTNRNDSTQIATLQFTGSAVYRLNGHDGSDGLNYTGQKQIPQMSAEPVVGNSVQISKSTFIRIPQQNEHFVLFVSYNQVLYTCDLEYTGTSTDTAIQAYYRSVSKSPNQLFFDSPVAVSSEPVLQGTQTLDIGLFSRTPTANEKVICYFSYNNALYFTRCNVTSVSEYYVVVKILYIFKIYNPITSVNGKTGVVVLTASDIYATNTQSVQANLERIDENYDLLDTKIGDLNDLDTENQDSIVDAINELESGRLAILALVPEQTSTSNQLADKAFVNSTVQTATSNFRGNWSNWASVPINADEYPEDYLGIKTPSTNDYMVIQDASGYVDPSRTLSGTWRFKYTGVWSTSGRNGWHPEYQVNETPMTAAQLAALNSGITSSLVQQITRNQDAISELDADKVDAEEGKGLSSNDYTDDDMTKVAMLDIDGDGDKFLSDDGTYKTVPTPTVDQSFDEDSENAQSGTAVAEAIEDIPRITAKVENEVLKINTGGQVSGLTVPTTTTAGRLLQSTTTGGVGVWGNSLPILTTEPSQPNSNGIIIVVLGYDPAIKYDGYLYLITEE